MSKKENRQTLDPHPGSSSSSSAAGDLTPVQLTALTAFAIFVGEALIMFVMPFFSELPVVSQAILDAVLLTLLTAPVLSFLLFRPMVEHIKERKSAERALLEVNESLEHRVMERTKKLSRTNKALNREIQDRRAIEERIRRTNDFVQRLIESAPCIMATVDVNSLKCNYVNGRIEDFLGYSPDEVAAARGALFNSIADSSSSERFRTMIQDVALAPEGEISRSRCELKSVDGSVIAFNAAVVVASRTPIGETEEVLFVATPVDDCG